MLFVTALVLALAAEPDPLKLRVGDDAPAFSLPASTGRAIQLSDYKGKKKVILAFFPKAFTGGCTREMAGLRDHQQMVDAAGAQVLAVSMDSVETQKRFSESLKLTFPVLADLGGKTASAYRVKGALWANRTTFVISEEGRILAIFEGKDALDPAMVVAATRTNPPSGNPRLLDDGH